MNELEGQKITFFLIHPMGPELRVAEVIRIRKAIFLASERYDHATKLI